MRVIALLSIITITFLFQLTIADAEEVPWTGIEYTASAKAEIIDLQEDYQETIGPPLPIDVSAYVNRAEYEASGSSQVDSSIINISTSALACG